ncbi:PhzF family phenazine biosynthesis protein [Microbacterium sp. NPDC058345]|uniref:PhzF family phenazine biosynthesis protein n=1 Tax=Microbacterium sp. NPDC058345 TaxID=3346455 RepID=UPI00364A6707
MTIITERRARHFAWVDVFTDVPLTGNPLPVVPDADTLSTREMQSIAREFNQSETTFILRPDQPEADWRLRSFTPSGAEVLGAGHNALGAWVWLAVSGRLADDRHCFTQQIGDALLPVSVDRSDPGATTVTLGQSSPVFGDAQRCDPVLAEILGIGVKRVASGPMVASTGVPHLLVEVSDERTVDAASPHADRLRAYLARVGAEGCYVYTVTPEHEQRDAYARFFNPTVGIVEDPATGTAAGPLAALLAQRDKGVAGIRSIRIEQGTRLGRPSTLTLHVDDGIRLSGGGVVIAEGELVA